jgi:hypothetical protein
MVQGELAAILNCDPTEIEIGVEVCPRNEIIHSPDKGSVPIQGAQDQGLDPQSILEIERQLEVVAHHFGGRLNANHVDIAIDQFRRSRLAATEFLEILDKARFITDAMSKRSHIRNPMGYFVACVQRQLDVGSVPVTPVRGDLGLRHDVGERDESLIRSSFVWRTARFSRDRTWSKRTSPTLHEGGIPLVYREPCSVS